MKAFPTHREEGMDLRDYFAAKVMQGLLSNAWLAKKNPMDRFEIARTAFALADAMIKERDRVKEQA